MIEINYEKIADGISDDVAKSEEFKTFCSEYSCKLEDELREALGSKFVEKLRRRIVFGSDDDGEMEFHMTLIGNLTHNFMKYFVTEYLGRKW